MGTPQTIPDPVPPTEEAIRAALRASRGSVTVAANTLGIHRTWLHRLMRRYGIEVTRIVA